LSDNTIITEHNRQLPSRLPVFYLKQSGVRLYFYLFFLLLIASCQQKADLQTQAPAERELQADTAVLHFQHIFLKQQLDSVLNNSAFNGHVSVHRDGKNIYKQNKGFADLEQKRPLDDESVFAIASVSKQFTAALILDLQHTGKLAVTDSVQRFLPDFKKGSKKNITISHLLNHTSGLADFSEGLQSAPGKEFHYSNKGYRLLGNIVEKASGKSFDVNLQNLLKKTGLRQTFSASGYSGSQLAWPYIGTATRFERVAGMPERLAQPAISVPAGGILATAADLHRWAAGPVAHQLLYKNDTVNKHTRFHHPILGSVRYSNGLMHDEEQLAFFHTGYVKGSASLLIYYPSVHMSVVILNNVTNEAAGKKSIFKVHRQVKEITDQLMRADAEFRKAPQAFASF